MPIGYYFRHQTQLSKRRLGDFLLYLLFGPVLLFGLLLLALSACDWEEHNSLGVKSEEGDSEEEDPDDPDNPEAPSDDDADGLSNSVEDVFDMLPRDADSDNDGFDDGLEFVGDQGDPLASGLSPISFNRSRNLAPSDVINNDPDRDLDGLGDTFERDKSLDPENADTDGDGYQDGLELVAGSDPFLSSSRPVRDTPPAQDGPPPTLVTPPDTDGDGMSNDIEQLNGTLINQRDTDGDGFSDGLEFLMGSDGTDARNVPNFSVPPPPEVEESS